MAGSNPLLRHPRFETLKHLGSGTYGRVILAKDTHDDRMVAIKLLNRGSTVMLGLSLGCNIVIRSGYLKAHTQHASVSNSDC